MPNQLTTDERQLSPGKDGQAIVISILLVGVLLSIVLTLSSIFAPKVRSSSEIKRSSAALYAAESGVEWCLYIKRKDPQPAPPSPVMSNSASYINGFSGNALFASDCSADTIKVMGIYQGVSRTFEISF
jgi:hypothetical protein